MFKIKYIVDQLRHLGIPRAADDFIATQNLDNSKNASVQDLTSRLKGIGVQNMDDMKLLSKDAIRDAILYTQKHNI